MKRPMTASKLKKKVLKHLNKNGDTFISITNQLLNTGIEQHQVQYLLNELERDGLIILGKANDRLNVTGVNAHILSANSHLEARITPQGKAYVKEHLTNSILDYLEKHPLIRTIVLIGSIGGGIAIIIAIVS